MKARDCLSELIGKTISGVLVTSGNYPRSQLILTLSDGTAIEFWTNGEPMEMAAALDQESLDEIIENLTARTDTHVIVFRPSHEDQQKAQQELL